jgi:signal transduction histidine kinase
MIVGAARGGWPPTGKAVVAYAAAFAAIAIGVAVWEARPGSRTGPLLTAIPFAAVLSDVDLVFRGSALAQTVGVGVTWLLGALMAHVFLSYPSGRLTSRLDRGFIAVAYGFATVYGLLYLLFYDPRSTYDRVVLDCPDCAVPYLHVAWLDMTEPERVLEWVALAFALVCLGLLVRKLVRASRSGRVVVLPLAVAGCFVIVQFAVQIALYGRTVNSWTQSSWFWIVTLAQLAVPVALAAGLLWRRREGGPVAGLVVALEHTPPGSVRDALARTLGDPSLELALWLPDRASYVDVEGRPVVLPDPGGDRAVTVLGEASAPVAALIHDPVLLERRALLTSAGAAARLALENARLQAELRAQLAELRASRARIVTAGDNERRRLERDLHDGAQQRLLSLGLALQLVRAQLGPDANGASGTLAEADGELRAALDELRELARGIHPAVLTEQGLGAALRSLAERSPVPVTIVNVPDERLAAPAEAAAYFLVSEALTNAAKHASASSVRVSVAHVDGRVLVDVDDDGVGGADPARGSGLRGLADRVIALDGELGVESPPGSGTHVHAEIPCV